MLERLRRRSRPREDEAGASGPQAAQHQAPVASDTETLIDVRDLIARYSNTEHIARADAYFASMPDDAPVLRKPFFGFADAQKNMAGLSELLQRLQLFEGARVMDFGAGTGWLSKIFAYLGCRPIAMDISASGLALGRRAYEQDPLMAGRPIEWRVFDGVTLPLEDESVDRIVCYDSFHHVADQAAILREFHRVLVPGGRIAFHEPGPTHSRTPEAQHDMRKFDVIENDIVVEDIWRIAEDLGFIELELALSAIRTVALPLDRYQRVIAGKPAAADVAAVMQTIYDAGAGLREFSMVKIPDSFCRAGLAARIEVALTDTQGDMLRGRARVTNTGVRWRPSTGARGGVWLGVKRDGADYSRVWLSDSTVLPGQAVEVPVVIPAPAERPVELSFDLVSEHVAWVSELGGALVTVRVE